MPNFDELLHFVPLVSPVDLVATDSTSACVDLGETTWAQLYCFFGTITNASATVTVEKCTSAAGAGNTAIAFNYRVSAAAGTDTMGAKAAATSAGVDMTASDDDKCLIIDISPSEVSSGGPYVRVVCTTPGGMAACEYAAWALVLPRKAQNITSSVID